MKKVIFYSVLILAFGACKNDSTNQDAKTETATLEQSNIFLNCVAVEGMPAEDPPTNEVFLQISESKVKVADVLNCETLTHDQYTQYHIPENAISAVGGWWAGAGEYIYVIKDGTDLVIMQGEMYEEKEDDDYNYKLIARFNSKGERLEMN